MSYGTFLFPEDEREGLWRLQTDNPVLIALMQERAWQSSSPWRQVGGGTSFIYCRWFASSRNAKDAVTRILKKLPAEAFGFVKAYPGIGWEIKSPPDPQVPRNTCAYAGLNQEPHSPKAAVAAINL
jgi:hypothetical protein